MNYTDNVLALYGMTSIYGNVDEENKIIYKNKGKTKCIVFDKNQVVDGVEEINYSYIEEKPDFKKFYKSTLIIQGPFNKEWFELKGHKNLDLRNTRNKFDKCLVVKDDCDVEIVLNLVKKWEVEHGHDHYRMQMHSGYDKKFFREFKDFLKDRVKTLFFFDKETDVLVGYAVFAKDPIDNEFTYLIRKYDPTYKRNLCVYIDFYVSRYLNMLGYENFTINYGASGGGCKKFKTMRFPVKEMKTVYFWKIKKTIN